MDNVITPRVEDRLLAEPDHLPSKSWSATIPTIIENRGITTQENRHNADNRSDFTVIKIAVPSPTGQRSMSRGTFTPSPSNSRPTSKQDRRSCNNDMSLRPISRTRSDLTSAKPRRDRIPSRGGDIFSRRGTYGDANATNRKDSKDSGFETPGAQNKRNILRAEFDEFSMTDVQHGYQKRRGSSFAQNKGLKNWNSLINSQIKTQEKSIYGFALFKKFRMVARLAVILIRMLKFHMKTIDKRGHFIEQFGQIDGAASIGIETKSDLFFDPSDFKANKQMRMTAEAKRILSKPPEERTEQELYYATIALRSNQQIADYPVRFQRKLAQNGKFESYEAMRVIVRQGHPPQAFYFIMYGTVIVAVLTPGHESAKTVCHLHKGDSFGELAIRNLETRQSTVITKNYVEMLSISAETYQKVFMVGGSKNIHDPDHNAFISSIDFLRGWPVSILDENPNKFVFTYFKRNDVMVKDSCYSDWIYIVKSGSITVLKKLIKTNPSIDPQTGKHIIRCKKYSSDEGYKAFLSNDYKTYISEHSSLNGHRDAVEKAIDSVTKANEQKKITKSSGKKALLCRPKSEGQRLNLAKDGGSRRIKSAEPSLRGDAPSNSTNMEVDDKNVKGRLDADALEEKQNAEPDFIQNMKRLRSAKAYVKQGVELFRKRKKNQAVQERYKKKVIASDDQEDATKSTDFKEQKRTFLDDLDAAYQQKEHVITEADRNPQFVKVQTLTKGSVFGLPQVVFGKQPSFCLISNGAECLMLNKQFYLEHCPQEVRRKLIKTVSPYPTDKEMQDNLVTRMNWDALRQSTLNGVMSDIQGLKNLII